MAHFVGFWVIFCTVSGGSRHPVRHQQDDRDRWAERQDHMASASALPPAYYGNDTGQRRMDAWRLSKLMGHASIANTQYSNFHPDRWWKTRSGLRTEFVELQKLLFDIVLHPMSFLTSRLS
jgi:hypothetical protein